MIDDPLFWTGLGLGIVATATVAFFIALMRQGQARVDKDDT